MDAWRKKDLIMVHIDNSCSKHMTENVESFFSFKTLEGGGVLFGNDKRSTLSGLEELKITRIFNWKCVLCEGAEI